MAIRFRKSKKLLPGVKLNVGKKSVGVRIGGKNAGVSIGTGGKSVSASLPGTGFGISSQSRKGCMGAALFLAVFALAGMALIVVPTMVRQANAIEPDPGVYTLYRSSAVEGIEKVHVATFDSGDGRDYNRENCWLAADLFKGQPGVIVHYWCEEGRDEHHMK